MAKFTPMMKQYHRIKKENPGVLLFFRLGDFYEMFYDDAVTASRELEITLTSRNNDSEGHPIPMCGVPHHAATGYLNRLLKKGYRVAVCDQVEDPRQAKGVVRREVTRILSPGTVIDETALETKENNYLAAISEINDRAAAALLDVSTGDFWCVETEGEDRWSGLEEQLRQFGPSELLVAGEEGLPDVPLSPQATENLTVTAQPGWIFNTDYAERALLAHCGVVSLDGLGLEEHPAAVSAAGAVVSYVRTTQRSSLSHVSRPRLLEPRSFLKMDDSTVRNLELVRCLDGGRQWTLFAALDLTRTSMGARRLRRWLLRPLVHVAEINRRLDAVGELTATAIGMDRLGEVLDGIHDLERLLSRVSMGTASPRDLVALGSSLGRLPDLERELEPYGSALLSPEVDPLSDVVELLDGAIEAEPPVSLADGGVIRAGFDAGLDELREISSSGKCFIAALEARERERTGISSLKVKYNRVFGYFIDVTRANLDKVPDDYIRKQTLANSERFITPELKEYEEKVLTAEEQILVLERELFTRVREQVAAEAHRISEAARLVSRLDVLLAFARGAHQHRYVRPVLDDSEALEIREGRHPVVERQSDEPFVPNDLRCNTSTDQMLILTGPNMGGKSTYLRQNALIVIMAQMGAFVPAESARVGLVDRVFTRVGASDDLARGRSTFMVEMIETARILNTATPRSLVLLDEVGRGTATFDGLSIAWAVAEYLIEAPDRKARTLFATHYQELTRLEKLYEGVRNYCVTIHESGDDIVFFHRVLAGSASKSYGIEVARLAGLPEPVIARAREILTRLERKRLNLMGSTSSQPSEEALDEIQQKLFQGH